MINGTMQLIVASQASNRLSHTIRFPTSWQRWGDVTAVIGFPSGIVYDIAAAEVGPDVHYLAATNGGLFHTIRIGNPPSWQPWRSLGALLGLAKPADVAHVAAANVQGDLHVVASLYPGDLLHTMRSSQDARWQPWRDIKAAAGPTQAAVVNVAAAAIGEELHVVVVRLLGSNETDILHTIRFPAGARWQPWGNVHGAAGPLTGFISGIAAAALRFNLHVVTTNGDSIFHTIRFPTSWQPWGDVESATAERGAFWNVAAANAGGDLHLVAAARVGAGIQTDLLHTIRFTQQDVWQSWGSIEAVVGDPGDVRTFAVA